MKKIIFLFMWMFIMSNYIVGQSTLYVNDGSTTGDAYTSAIGNDLTGTGSQSAPYATIAKAMSVITTGAIYVDAGNYSVNGVTIKPSVKLAGLCPASSIITGS